MSTTSRSELRRWAAPRGAPRRWPLPASTLPEYPLEIYAGGDHVEAVSAALAAFGTGVREAIAKAGEVGDADTEDLFVGVSRDVDKNLWLVEAHAQAAS